MEHKIVEISNHGEVIVMGGEVQGTFYPSNNGDQVPFSTKNLFVFKRVEGQLKIAKVIYNSVPLN